MKTLDEDIEIEVKRKEEGDFLTDCFRLLMLR